ncbi:MAG: 5'-3' exonuclease H3TH domain-containing protein, partial [Candidatus Neomarinimicrobiota bacterium]
MADPRRLFIFDGTALLYRAHFAMINNPLKTSTGQVTSGIFGFMTTMNRLLREEAPDDLAIVFDDRAKTFRHKMYTEYKATREKMPADLVSQLEPLYSVLEALNVPVLRMPGYEADDVMGTLATRAEALGWESYLVTGDKDMLQLVSEHTFVYMPGRGGSKASIYDHEKVVERWGVAPEQMIDLLGLMGDSSDNVPGVPGVGEKTARTLIADYGSLEEALPAAAAIAHKRLRGDLEKAQRLIQESGTLDQALSRATEVGRKRDQVTLKTARQLVQEYGALDQALSHAAEIAQKQVSELGPLSKELVTIDCEVPLEVGLDSLSVEGMNPLAAAEALKELEIKAAIPDMLALAGEEPLPETPPPEKHYDVVTTEKQLQAMVRQLTRAKWIAFDLETTSINPLAAEIVGLSFSTKAHHGWYVPVQYPEREERPGLELPAILERLKPLLEDPKRPIMGQNIKYDALVMTRYDIEVRGIFFDTMIAAHLVEPDAPTYKLDALSEKYLNYRMVPIEELIGKRGKEQRSMAEVPLEQIAFYATEDADVVG